MKRLFDSIDLVGASISLLHLDRELRELLHHPCRIAFLQVGRLRRSRSGETMVELLSHSLNRVFHNISDAIEEAKVQLSVLDGADFLRTRRETDADCEQVPDGSPVAITLVEMFFLA